MEISVNSRSGKLIAKVMLDLSATLADLKRVYYDKCIPRFPRYIVVHKFYPERQAYTFHDDSQKKDVPLKDDSKKLSDYGMSSMCHTLIGIRGGDVVVFKDLGAQISWRTVRPFPALISRPIGVHHRIPRPAADRAAVLLLPTVLLLAPRRRPFLRAKVPFPPSLSVASASRC